MRNLVVLGSVVCLVSAASLGAGQKASAAKPTFASVDAILKKNCVGCHQGPNAANGLNLTTHAMVMKGDKKGKVVVAKNAASSRLSKAIHRVKGVDAMPPGQALTKAQVAVIDGWIKAGAKK